MIFFLEQGTLNMHFRLLINLMSEQIRSETGISSSRARNGNLILRQIAILGSIPTDCLEFLFAGCSFVQRPGLSDVRQLEDLMVNKH